MHPMLNVASKTQIKSLMRNLHNEPIPQNIFSASRLSSVTKIILSYNLIKA